MRGTLLDNEPLRRRGIKEMQEARTTRILMKKRDAARAASGKPPLGSKVKKPLLRFSFLRYRPQPMGKRSSGAVVRHKSQSPRPKAHSHHSSSRKKKSSQGSKTGKRSTAHKRSGRPAKKGSKK